MDLNAVLTAITTVGFPIVMCLAMGYYIKYALDKNREEIGKLNALHKEEVTKLNETHATEIKEVTSAINNNTIALQRICDKLDLIK